MRSKATRILMAATLAIAPVAAFAAQTTSTTHSSTHQSSQHHSSTKSTMGDHATAGVVKTVSPTELVITKSGKQAGEMTFVLNSSTKKEGKVDVGTPVSVRYKENGTSHVATAIMAQHTKAQSTSTHKSSSTSGKSTTTSSKTPSTSKTP
jgi:hypothetical protein